MEKLFKRLFHCLFGKHKYSYTIYPSYAFAERTCEICGREEYWDIKTTQGRWKKVGEK